MFHVLTDGLAEITLDDLRGAADGAAVAILDAAARFAVARITHDPWPATRTRALPATITQRDLLRALIGWAPDAVREAFLAEPAEAALRDAAERSRAAALPDGRVDKLERNLGARWQLAWPSLERPVRVAHLLGSLDFDGIRALAAFDRRLREGLVTEDEAFDRAFRYQRGVYQLPPAPLVIADRAGLIDRIEHAMQDSPAVCVVSIAAHVGRRTLIEHVLARGRVSFRAGDGWFRLATSLIEPDLFATAELSRDAVLWTQSGRGEIGRADAKELSGALRAALSGSGTRVVLSLTQAEHERLAAQVPELRSALRVELPPVTERDRLPRWLSHVIRATDDDGIGLTVSEIMSAFDEASSGERATPTQEAVQRAVRVLRARGLSDRWRVKLRRVMHGKPADPDVAEIAQLAAKLFQLGAP